jgi:hypothetical protein
MNDTTRSMLLIGAGAILAAVVIELLEHRAAPVSATSTRNEDSSATTYATPPARITPQAVTEMPHSPVIAAPAASSTARDAPGSRGVSVVEHAPADTRVPVTDVPNRSPDHAARSDAAQLLNGTRISCDFGAGVNTGVRFGDTLSVGGGAEWSGGLIVYQLLDAAAGRVTMTGSVGATGSPNGEAKVDLITVDTQIVLSGLLPNGGFVLTTIYPERDDLGRHVAVMSRHADQFFTYAAQFLGTCQ